MRTSSLPGGRTTSAGRMPLTSTPLSIASICTGIVLVSTCSVMKRRYSSASLIMFSAKWKVVMTSFVKVQPAMSPILRERSSGRPDRVWLEKYSECFEMNSYPGSRLRACSP